MSAITPAGPSTLPDVTDRPAVLRRRVRRLVAATITYNLVEAVVAITAGIGASSVALVGFASTRRSRSLQPRQ